MGMTCTLYRAPDSTLQVLLSQPEYFYDFERLGEKPFRYEVKPGFVGRLLGRKPKIVQLGHDELPFPPIGESECYSLDKSWHILHYLITGRASESDGPLGFLLSGGSLIGQQEVGRDAVPRAFSSGQTMAISERLSHLNRTAIKERFDWPEMMRQEVYPEIQIAEKFPLELWATYSGQLDDLLVFLRDTANARLGMVISCG